MTALILAQTFFYFTVSFAVIAVGVLCVMVTYHLMRIVRELEELSRNLNHASAEAIERINDVIDRLSELPVLSYFLKKRSANYERKGRKR